MAPPPPIRLYFLGSGHLGLPLLRALAAAAPAGLVLAGVGTQPDRPRGRHRALAPTPIGAEALRLGLAPDRPACANAPEFVAHLRQLDLDLAVVVAYGQLLKEPLFTAPRHGCLNVHASLLPRHRGASPVQAAILAGDGETGVSFMRIDRGLDTGPVWRQIRLPLRGTETADALETALGELAAAHLAECITAICRAGLQPVPQPAAGATVARKITKGQGLLDWTADCGRLERQVRAFHPWPGTWFFLPTPKGRRRVMVTAVRPRPAVDAHPGCVVQADQDAWIVACGHGALELGRVVPEGRGEMNVAEFLRGCPVATGTRLANDSNLSTELHPTHEADPHQCRGPGDPGRRRL
ncbi:MAG: methionyl-tRNA formyltransferase [Lentisphaeria bacterium]